MRNAVRKLIGTAVSQLRPAAAPRNIAHGYDFEEEARQAIARVRERTMLSYECLVTLFNQVRHCESQGVPGDFVECGVWKGGAVALMALANQAFSPHRRNIRLFDAFDDICEPDPTVDGDRAVAEVARWGGVPKAELAGRLTPLTGIYDHRGGPGRLPDVRQFLEAEIGYDREFLHYHQGWFQETLPTAELGDIAILRLDGDWYASTRVCLEHLYPRVVAGGFVIIDDYGAYEGCRRAVDEYRTDNRIGEYLNHVNTDCRYWIKR